MDEATFVNELLSKHDALRAMLCVISGDHAAVDDLFQEMALVMTRRRGGMAGNEQE